mgnify:CR=1 FL=1
MDQDEAHRLVASLDVSDKLKASMMRTFDALQDRWEKDRDTAATAYQIDIPAQSIRICGELQARSGHAEEPEAHRNLSGDERWSK